MTSVLETERLILRPPSVDADAPAFAALMSDAIARWTGSWGGTNTRADVARRIEAYLETEARGLAFNRTLVLKATGEAIGLIGVRRLETEPGRGAIGYWIGEPFFGRGYTLEAARAMLDTAWTLLPVAVIEGVAQLPNTASRRILLALGMSEVGERMEFASARGAADRCAVYEIARP
jgi:RimJ/RimL family protein N-acetyltransferase